MGETRRQGNAFEACGEQSMQNEVQPNAVPTSSRPLRDSSLFITVPEAEPVVRRWRAEYDRTAPVGFPAHITLLYPFLPPNLITDRVTRDLAELFAGMPPFEFKLSGVCGFRGLVWLAPEPAEPFVRLTRELCAAYPQLRPYGDGTRTVPPHLTVARSQDIGFLRDVTQELTNALPVTASAREIWLLAESQPTWRVHSRYQLGQRHVSASETRTIGRHITGAPAPQEGSPSGLHPQAGTPP